MYDVIILDCDGVILDSNNLKSQIMGRTVSNYGDELKDAFVCYHKRNGGLSRYEKFDYFLRHITNNFSEGEYSRLLNQFSSLAEDALLNAPLANGAIEFLQKHYKRYSLFVVSGGDQMELCRIFKKRKLDKYFQGIFGSPTDKARHCESIIKNLTHPYKIILIGDSHLDYLAAQSCGSEFIFLSSYTEMVDWENFCLEKNIDHFPNLASLISYF
ncbi:HAD family hydrolase [Arenicellales bacterium IMCC56312]